MTGRHPSSIEESAHPKLKRTSSTNSSDIPDFKKPHEFHPEATEDPERLALHKDIHDEGDLQVAYGARRTEAIDEQICTWKETEINNTRFRPLKILFFVCLFLTGYASGLGGQLSQFFQTMASNNFKMHAQGIASVNTVKSVVASAVAVPYARISDRFGRMETWMFATLIYTVGVITCAATPTFAGLFAGVVIQQFGYSGFRLLAWAMSSDFSTLRDRTFAMNVFLIPVIINTWVSGDIADSIAGDEEPFKWRWGYGIFAIIVPVSSFLLLAPYGFGQYLASRAGKLPRFQFRKPGQSWGSALWDFTMNCDLIGVFFFAAALVLVLLPLTLAGGRAPRWKSADVISMIVIGGCLAIVFIIWEFFFARKPFVPKYYLGNTTIYGALLLEFVWRVALQLELQWLLTVLMVAFNQNRKSAQRISQLYNFLQSCTNFVMGIVLHWYPHPKLFVFLGASIGLLGMGLLYKYRTTYDGISGLIGAEICIGIGGGMTRFPTYTLVHASTSHIHLATVIGLLSSVYQMGQAVGSSVAGAVWTQRLPKMLIERLGPEAGMEYYKQPLNLKAHPMGSESRKLIIEAFSEIQRLLIICAISFAALNLLCTVLVRNIAVSKTQSYNEEERLLKHDESRKYSAFRHIVGY